MLYLKEANFQDIEKEYEFITELPTNENGFTKIKTLGAKQWIIKMNKDGRGYSTITSVRNCYKTSL